MLTISSNGRHLRAIRKYLDIYCCLLCPAIYLSLIGSQVVSPIHSPLRLPHWNLVMDGVLDLVRITGNVLLPDNKVPGPHLLLASTPLPAWLQMLQLVGIISTHHDGANPKATAICLTRSFLTISLPGYRSQTPSTSSSLHGGPEMRLGDRVLVAGQRTGVVHFYGKTSFAPGQHLRTHILLCPSAFVC